MMPDYPKMLAPAFDTIPIELRDRPQWVGWQSGQRKGNWTKIPRDPRAKRRNARADDPSTWGTSDQACSWYNTNGGAGIGYVFAKDDPFVGVDLDKCRVSSTGTIEPWAQSIIDRLGSYTELSPSGTGIHIFIQGRIPGKRCRSGKLEMYDRARFYCVTGHHVEGTPTTIEERSAELAELYRETFGDDAHCKSWQVQPSPVGPEDDADLIEKAKSVANGDKFSRLWEGDMTGYHSPSEADLALCDLLSFWTGIDPDRIDRLFRQSGLYRDKWERGDYRRRTIQKALSERTEFHRTVDTSKKPVSRPSRSYPWTDSGNAERLVDRHGQNFRFRSGRSGNSEAGTWFVWQGGRWVGDCTFHVARWAKNTVREMYSEASIIEDDDRRKKFLEFVRSCESNHRRAAMVTLAKKEPGIAVSPTAFDSDVWLLNCPNGTLDLRSGRLREHRRSDLLTRQTPVKYDPSAQCPRWARFLREIMGANDELIQFLQRLIGMCLTGDIREQILPIFYGVGANGKSVFMDAISGVMGPYACDAPPGLLTVRKIDEHPTEIADLFGRRLVVASETQEGRRLRVELVKRLTGDATLKARFMREDYFQFERTHKTILATNNRPAVRENKTAIWRRLKLVPFAVTIPPEEQDRQLTEKLRAEWTGILRWAVEGCLAWQADGELCFPSDVEDATEAYRSEEDVLLPFIEDRCVLESKARVTRASLWTAYTEWAQTTGEKYPLDRAAFYERLRLRGCEDDWSREEGKQKRGFRGIRLLSQVSCDKNGPGAMKNGVSQGVTPPAGQL